MHSPRPALAAAPCLWLGILLARALGPPAGAGGGLSGAGPDALVLLGVAGVAAAVVAALRPAPPVGLAGLAVAGALAGVALGLLRPAPGPARHIPDRPGACTFTGRVRTTRAAGDGTSVELDVGRLDGRPARFGARVWVPPGGPVVVPGDVVWAQGALWAPDPPLNPGAPDLRPRLARAGVGRLGRVRGLVVLSAGPAGVARRLALARLRVRAACRRVTRDPAVAGVLQALSLGGSSAVPSPVRDAFARAGLAHLLAVSGLHLGLVAVLLFAGIRRAVLGLPWRPVARRANDVAALVAAPAVGFLVAWVGRPPSAARAGLMALVLLGAVAAGRRRDGWTALALAALALAAAAPDLLFRPGFQLSFAAVAGLLAYLPHLPVPAPGGGWARRLLRSVAGTAGATLAASLATAPLCALHFGRVALTGTLANLVAVPLAGLLVPAVAGAATATAWLGAAADPLWAPARWLARALVEVARTGAHLPLASVAVPPPGPLALAACAVLLVALARPGARRGTRLALAAGLAVLLVAAPHLGRRRPPPAPLAAYFLDVGHGDAILLRSRAGDVLVDAGGDPSGRYDVGARIVVPALRALGVRRLAAVFVTHPHPDHYRGVAAVARAFPVGALYVTGEALDGRGPYARMVAGLRRRGIPLRIACRAPLPDLAPARLTCLHPFSDWPAGTWDPLEEPNDNSIVLRVALGRVSLLLTGDIQHRTEARLLRSHPAELAATVVKAPHHGSRTSSTRAFVAATGARYVVFTVAPRSHFHFPAAAVVRRWRAAGARTFRTGVDGAVRVLTDGRRVQVESMRAGWRPWPAPASPPAPGTPASRTAARCGSRGSPAASTPSPAPRCARGARGGRG